MSTKTKVDTLWNEMRQAINKTYEIANREAKTGDAGEGAVCLRDYAENISWNDALSGLLGRESANERQHRSNRPSVPGFSTETAAKLILMSQVCEGIRLGMPQATAFLVFRKTAVEAQVIGALIRGQITQDWQSAVQSLDYSKLMQAGYPQKEVSA